MSLKKAVCAIPVLCGSTPSPAQNLINAAASSGAREIVLAFFGPNAKAEAEKSTLRGARRILYCQSPALEEYSTSMFSSALRSLISEEKPWAVIMPADHFSRAWAARTAAELECGLTADAVRLELYTLNDRIKAVKPTYGGKLMAEILSNSPIQMVTVRDGFFQTIPECGAAAPPVADFFFQSQASATIRQTSLAREDAPGADITAADYVIAAGKGVSPETFGVIKELSAATGWAIGATRPLVEEGLIPECAQIGITGKNVSPKLYIGLGISGKMQHTHGITGAKTVISVNKDPGAQIRDISDIFVEADLKDFLPAFLSEIKKLKGS